MSNSVVTELDSNANEIPSLLVPMTASKLVLPTVSVAEMIPYQTPQPSQHEAVEPLPEWYLGELFWRGILVPMISYELINGGRNAPLRPESQVIILNNTGVSSQLTFLCMPTQGIPRLSRVAPNEISENTNIDLKDYDQMHVFVAGEAATIPDVSKLEHACATVLGYA